MGEVELAVTAGQVRQSTHDEVIGSQRRRDLRHGTTLHLDGLRSELFVQLPARGRIVDEDVAGRHQTLHDPWWCAVTAGPAR